MSTSPDRLHYIACQKCLKWPHRVSLNGTHVHAKANTILHHTDTPSNYYVLLVINMV